MYELAKKSREAMKSKARRLAGEKDMKVDSSNWTPPPLLKADIKTGARPIMKPSAKGVGESNAARDTKAAIGDPKRGAFKRGGVVKKSDGGKLPSVYEAMKSEERQKNIRTEDSRKMPSPQEAADSAARTGDRKNGGRNWIKDAIKKPGALRKSLGVKKGETIPAKKLDKAAEAPGKLGQRARLAKTLKSMKTAKKNGGGVGLTVVINDKGQQQPQGANPMTPRATPVPMPSAQPPAHMPMPVMPPPPQPPVQSQAPIKLKTGGRINRNAASYRDMEASAANGEGRLQKTSIAKKKRAS